MTAPEKLLSVQHLRRIVGTLPACNLSRRDIEERLASALIDYAHDVTYRDLALRKPSEMRDLRAEILKTARKLKKLMEGEDYLFAMVPAKGGWPLKAAQLEHYIDWVEEADKRAPKRGRGGRADDPLNALTKSLMEIYVAATGEWPTSSWEPKLMKSGRETRDIKGPWPMFFREAISEGAFGTPVLSNGLAITPLAFEQRWRRIARLNRQSPKNGKS